MSESEKVLSRASSALDRIARLSADTGNLAPLEDALHTLSDTCTVLEEYVTELESEAADEAAMLNAAAWVAYAKGEK